MKIASFCILGRANVGKSTFFNCLSPKKTITKERRGDKRLQKILVEYQDFFFFLVDWISFAKTKQYAAKNQKIKLIK